MGSRIRSFLQKKTTRRMWRGGHRHGNSAGSARAAAGTRASRVHSRSSNTTGGAREISINAALCNVPRDRGDQHTIYRYRDLRLSSRLSFSF